MCVTEEASRARVCCRTRPSVLQNKAQTKGSTRPQDKRPDNKRPDNKRPHNETPTTATGIDGCCNRRLLQQTAVAIGVASTCIMGILAMARALERRQACRQCALDAVDACNASEELMQVMHQMTSFHRGDA